jgi:hypothetical protein
MKNLALVGCFLLILAVFCVLALEQDKLNARIRTLEIQAGLGDKWAEKR